MDRRKPERRALETAADFPLLTLSGRIMGDRRRQPDRRLNKIRVMFPGITCCAGQPG